MREFLRRRTPLLLLGSILFTVAANVYPQQGRASTGDRGPIVVWVLRTQGQLTIKVESRTVEGEGVLNALGKLLLERGREYPVVGLVDYQARLSDVDLVDAFAGKVGFQKIRTFVVNPEAGKMAEIKFCPAIPISENPPSDPECSRRR
jgi:hypothetical protein